jgi:glycosyltransferase involved in cell wall biosynthesis
VNVIGIAILVFLALAVCADVLLLVGLRALSRAPRLYPCGSRDSEKEEVSVVIAARNEGDQLATCIKSLLVQEVIQEIIIVDDHSEDHTRAVATELAITDPRVLVLSAPDLPPKWIGKSHAIYFGAQHVHGKYILFTDADVTIVPGLLSAATEEMSERHLDHLGGLFYLRCESIAEQICAPVLMAASSVALFRSTKTLGAGTGAFNMLRTAFYQKHGGHQAILNRVVDDVALARHAKASGGRSAFLHMGDGVNVRLFRGFQGFFSAVVRSAVPFLTIGKFTAFMCALALGSEVLVTTLAVPIAVGLLVYGGFEGSEMWKGVLFLGAVAYVLGFACTLQTTRYHDGKRCWGLLYPLPVALMACATGYAAVASMLGKKIKWRGRVYEHM